MKIGPLTEAVRFFNRIQERHDSGGNPHDTRDHDQREKESKEETPEVTSEKLEAAVDQFKSDAQAKESGLSASMIGKGPGLRVVLKDGTGATIRQFTGEEFLKLREAAGKDTRARGKILDQKF